MVRSAVKDEGELIQLAHHDVSSNLAKREIDMEKQLVQREIRITTNADFETILTIRELQGPIDTIELKFETVVAGANDPTGRQMKGRFFIDRAGLNDIQQALSQIAISEQGS